MRRRITWQAASTTTAVLTIVLMVLNAVSAGYFPDSDALAIPLGIISMPFEFGVIAAASFYGGLHDNPPMVPIAVIASVINGALAGGVIVFLDFLRGSEA